MWQSWASEIRSCRTVLDPGSLWWRPQGVSSDLMKRGRAGRWEGISRKQEPNVMGTSPCSSAEVILCLDIHWHKCKVVLKADWFRHKLKALLRSSCTVSKIQHLCCNPWNWLCIWKKYFNDVLRWLRGSWACPSLNSASWSGKWVISDRCHQVISFSLCVIQQMEGLAFQLTWPKFWNLVLEGDLF